MYGSLTENAQYCGEIFSDSFETYKFDVQNHPFGWLLFENRFILIIK